jgi:hypothetical protein
MESLGITTEEEIWSIRNPLAETANMTSEYVTDENLQELILDLFPRIPLSDMKTIMEHAFERVLDQVYIEVLTTDLCIGS